MGSLIIAIDFDGVICTQNFPYTPGQFEELMPGVVETIQALKDMGHVLVINTCRGDATDIANFLRSNGIPFDTINTNVFDTPSHLNPGKPVADVYIDDKSLKFDSWDQVFQELRERFPQEIEQEDCSLCDLHEEGEQSGPVHFEDDICVIVDCKTCNVPMVVLKRHTTVPTEQEQQHMVRQLSKQGRGKIDKRRRTVPDHWHAHLR